MALTILTGSSQAAAFNYSYTTSGSADWASVPTASYFYDIVDKIIRYKTPSSEYANVATASLALTSSYTISSTNTSDILIYVKNTTGAPIAKGKVVRISGATGDIALISTASWDSDGVSANTLGILNETIADQSFGYAMTEGKLLGINTNNFTAGQLLFLGPTGSIINTEPVAPLHSVRLGQALRIQQNNGSMYVHIDNGYELDELHNVLIISGSDGDLIVASGSNGNGKKLYINSKQLTGSYGLTGSLTATSFTGSLYGTASHTNNALTASYVTSSNIYGPYGADSVASSSISSDASGIFSSITNNVDGYFLSSTGIQTIDGKSLLTTDGSIISINASLSQNGSSVVGNGSHAEGASTQAIGSYSHAEGNVTNTGTQNAYYAESVANGVVTLSSYYGDITGQFGANNRLYLYDKIFDSNYNREIFIISQSYYSGSTNTIVELYDTSVNTTTAYVGNLEQGIYNWTGDQIIPGDYSHTEGNATQTIGDSSHAEGVKTQAIGDSSHAEGDTTQAIGDSSHAEGYQTITNGNYSHTEGIFTQAIGQGSHAEGLLTIASGSFQHVSGKFNTEGDDTSLFIIGNGTGVTNRSDAFKVRESGSIILPVTSSNTPSWVGTNGEMIFGDDGLGNYVMYVWLGGAWRTSSLA